jgi:ferredoxin
MAFGLWALPLLSGAIGGFLFLFFLWAAIVSSTEGESQATVRLALMALILPVPLYLPMLLGGPPGVGMAVFLVIACGWAGVALFFPFEGRDLPDLGAPVRWVDERDIMFSRATLVPGTRRFEEYYQRRSGKRELDEAFRAEPGLLSPGAAHFHEQGFAAADAAFWTIELLRPFVEGGDSGWQEGGAEGVGLSKTKLGGETVDKPLEGVPSVQDPEAVTGFLKAWTLKMGAHSVGVTELKDHHLYTHVGRGPDYGREVALDHTFALALTVEMDKEMVDRAPRSPTAMESALQYLRGGVMAVQLADLIRRLGYQARAHIDGNYRVICPLVARDAGLGELGRMGLLMTPRLGPRVRIAVVTTDLPMSPDSPHNDPTTLDFCLQCKKCADCCPSAAIPFDDPREDENGVRRWTIDHEACFTLWGRLGTDCARCMAVCPYSHPDNTLHGLVRRGIRRNWLFRKAAVRLDDLVYGAKPSAKGEFEWMTFPEPTPDSNRMERQ